MTFRNLSSAETGSDQFEAACNFETSTCLLLLWIDTTTCTAWKGKIGVVHHRSVFLCMEVRIGILVNVRFYYGEISNEP